MIHWASFQTPRKRFRKLQEAMWLTVIDEIFKFSPYFYPFGQVNYLYMNTPQATRIIQLKNVTFGLISRLLERDFLNYRKPNV